MRARFRAWIHERRVCWWCHADFIATRRDVVFCSAVCGRAFRGLDEHGGPKKREAA